MNAIYILTCTRTYVLTVYFKLDSCECNSCHINNFIETLNIYNTASAKQLQGKIGEFTERAYG